MTVRKMMLNRRVAVIVMVVLGLLSRYSVAETSCSNITRYATSALHEYGYKTDTPQQIISAIKDPSYFIRYCALYVLTDHVGKKAVPVLVDALDDKEGNVRRRAAHLLGTLGSKAGLARMRQDLKTLAPANGAPPVYDPNLPGTLKEKAKRRRLYRLGRGLEVVKVLAELGDYSGYELAERMGLEEPQGAYRSLAVYALGELARIEDTIPPENGFHPTLALCAMAHSETHSRVFGNIIRAALSLGGARGLDILTVAKENPHQPQKELRSAATYMNALQRKKKQ